MTSQRIVLFLVGLLAAGWGAAYFGGVFEQPTSGDLAGLAAPAPVRSGATVEALTPPEETPLDGMITPDTTPEASSETQPDPEPVPGQNPGQNLDPVRPQTDGKIAAVAQEELVVPTFDILRVEADGSLVIAGHAAPQSSVEIVAGSSILATTRAGANGDFVSVLDRALRPGEHTVVLRSTSAKKISATSLETAIVSIPLNEAGDVVALVQQPGQPSRLISVAPGKTDAPIEAAAVQQPDADAEPGAMSGQGKEPQQQPGQQIAVGKGAESSPQQRGGGLPFIEAVEIDGRQIFVAGQADAGKRVRVYVNDVLLGQSLVDGGGHFLIQTERSLPVGDYIVRADVLDRDGVSVTSRAAVPFTREHGENMTSIALGRAETGLIAEAGDAGQAGAGPRLMPMAAPLQRQDGAVIIRKGDTLWHISSRVYGHGMRYTTIYQANKDQIRDPDLIWPGQTFSLPASSEEGEEADLSTVHGDRKGPATNN